MLLNIGKILTLEIFTISKWNLVKTVIRITIKYS